MAEKGFTEYKDKLEDSVEEKEDAIGIQKDGLHEARKKYENRPGIA